MARQTSTRDLSEERARLVAALLQQRRDLIRMLTRPEGTSEPAEMQRQQEQLDLVAAQLRETTAELEHRIAVESNGPGLRPRNTRARLAERQQAETWHHRRATPRGDRREEERCEMG